MKKIRTHLWFDTQAKEAAEFYTSLFSGSSIDHVSRITDTPSGDCDIVSFTLSGEPFMSISAGPIFKFNPSISISVQCETEEEIKKLHKALMEGGTELMPLDTYEFSKKFAWVQDKYGLSWQLNVPNDYSSVKQKISPFLMFVGKVCGKAEEAMEFYTKIFDNSSIDHVYRNEKDEGQKMVDHAEFTLDGQVFMISDSAYDHKFSFNEAISFIVNCRDQQEIDYYWEKLSAVPEAEQCGWLKDKFGVSWQIVPTAMDEMMGKGSKEQMERVTKAFMKMKKFDISELEKAYKGNE
ncbi:VOC family protein [Candidatus Roizmanbacteria bacterium]|nr:MAG: VOC family protein [Candidatus Roizmanbacteria bacterium]